MVDKYSFLDNAVDEAIETRRNKPASSPISAVRELIERAREEERARLDIAQEQIELSRKRRKAHFGILAPGDGPLLKEQNRFLKTAAAALKRLDALDEKARRADQDLDDTV